MYQAVTTAFDENNVGQAAAITVVFFLIVLAITLVQRRVLRRSARSHDAVRHDSSRLRCTDERTDDEVSEEIERIGPGPARRALSYLLLAVLTLLFIAPTAFMFIGCLKPSEQVLDGLGGFIPKDLSFDNYSGVFDRFNSEATGYFSWFFLISMLVAFVIVIAGLVDQLDGRLRARPAAVAGAQRRASPRSCCS